jgi:hypothetical protein
MLSTDKILYTDGSKYYHFYAQEFDNNEWSLA